MSYYYRSNWYGMVESLGQTLQNFFVLQAKTLQVKSPNNLTLQIIKILKFTTASLSDKNVL